MNYKAETVMKDKDRLQWILDSLDWYGTAYWFPEIVVKHSACGEDHCPPPTLKEFRAFIDKMKAESDLRRTK